ncbi:MAG TPA: hypothetical protein VFN88_06370 [Caulobacteraceae bacterium]|nr:hypothetical protein [Caulobacteraceae bacterium]
MTRNLLVLSCAAAALVGGAALAQDEFASPPLNQPDVETAAQYANQSDRTAPPDATSTVSDETATSTPIDTAVNPGVNDNTTIAETTTTTADTPEARNASARLSSATTSTDGAWTTQSQGTAAVGVAQQDNGAVAENSTDVTAQTPSSEPASASVSSMAYATNIANAPGGVFKANVGSYPMSHYASPSRPLPYDQVDAYLKAPRSQQLAQNWWNGSELASTAPASDVSASTPAASDVSSTITTSSASGASGTAGLPGDTRVGLNDDTSSFNSNAGANDRASINSDASLVDPAAVTRNSNSQVSPEQTTATPSASTSP